MFYIIDTPDEIRQIYPDEPLFENLKSADKSGATKGLLYYMRLIKDDIKAKCRKLCSLQ